MKRPDFGWKWVKVVEHRWTHIISKQEEVLDKKWSSRQQWISPEDQMRDGICYKGMEASWYFEITHAHKPTKQAEERSHAMKYLVSFPDRGEDFWKNEWYPALCFVNRLLCSRHLCWLSHFALLKPFDNWLKRVLKQNVSVYVMLPSIIGNFIPDQSLSLSQWFSLS